MKHEKTIFILGAGVMQFPALQAARQMGWRIIAADGNPDAPGKKLADIFEHIDLKDKELLAAAVKKYQADSGVDGVFTAGTDFSASVAWVAQECGLPGIPYEVAVCASEKQKMREKLRLHNIPQPDFIEVKDCGAVDITGLSFPLVVKPVDNMGARGVRRVDNEPELKAAVKEAMKFSRTHTVIVEEYIQGPEFSLDALVYDGQITLCGIADRHIVFEPWFIEMGHTMPTHKDPQTVDAITKVFFEAVRALGITSGAAKGDILLSADGPVIGEIAARLSGGYMSGWTYPYSSGVQLTKAGLLVAVGLPPCNLIDHEHAVSAERAFISIPGIVKKISGTDKAGNNPGVKEYFQRVREGETVVFPENNVQKCGNIITRGKTRDEAVAAAQNAIQNICIRLEPNNDATDAFLLGEVSGHIYAFSLAKKENIDFLKNMPAFYGNYENPVLDEISVVNLPIIQEETCRDWHQETIQKALARIAAEVPLRFTGKDGLSGPALGSLFWKAVLKAGVQGGLYVIDSLCDKARPGRYITTMIQEFRK